MQSERENLLIRFFFFVLLHYKLIRLFKMKQKKYSNRSHFEIKVEQSFLKQHNRATNTFIKFSCDPLI